MTAIADCERAAGSRWRARSPDRRDSK